MARNIFGVMASLATLSVQVGASIIQKPVEEGSRVSLVCQAAGHPTPTVSWRKAVGKLSKGRSRVLKGKLEITNLTKADGGDYICSAKNILNEDYTFAQVTVIEQLKLTSPPFIKHTANMSDDVLLTCSAQGAREIMWQRKGQILPSGHILYSNGSLLLKNVLPNDAGSYTCCARHFHRSVTACTVLEVRKLTWSSCSEIKRYIRGTLSGTYTIDPDSDGGVTPFNVYCDMSDKGGVGVTVISYYSERRTHVGPNLCQPKGCYSKDVRYTGVGTAQLTALTRASQNCEQFIKYECNNDVGFLDKGYAWWVSRDGARELLGRSYRI